MDDVAGDAELQEKSQGDLQHVADLVLNLCQQTMKDLEEQRQKTEQQNTAANCEQNTATNDEESNAEGQNFIC